MLLMFLMKIGKDAISIYLVKMVNFSTMKFWVNDAKRMTTKPLLPNKEVLLLGGDSRIWQYSK